MPRTAVTASAVKGPYPTLPIAANGADLTLAAADTVNFNQVAMATSRGLLLAWNSDVAAHTVTLTSLVDPFNRTGDVSAYSVDPGDIMGFIFERAGWVQTDGNLYFQANHAGVKFAYIPL